MNYFYSVNSQRTIELKIKRSTFICTMKSVEELSQAKGFISEVSREHKTATHNCWAYIVGEKGETFHASDAGEPAGTAGPPMLNTLFKFDMTNTAAVVTRYFGGVKLGIKGLIDAYGDCVKQCIEQAPLKKLVKTASYEIQVPYPFNDTLIHLLQNYRGRFKETVYTDTVTHLFEVEKPDCQDVEELLTEYRNAGKLTFSL
ncbi:MAG: YigZ family protein [Desulfobacteraceae bacterium]